MGAMLEWYKGLKSSPEPGGASPRAMSVAKAAGHATIGALVAGGLGLGFGLASSNLKNGLDFKIGTHSLPIDILTGLGAGAAAAVMNDSALAPYLRTAADSSFAIAGFRHGEAKGAAASGTGAQVMAAKAAKIKAAGEDDDHSMGAEDPILAFGRSEFANS